MAKAKKKPEKWPGQVRCSADVHDRLQKAKPVLKREIGDMVTEVMGAWLAKKGFPSSESGEGR